MGEKILVDKKIWGSLKKEKKGRQKSLGIYGQKRTTLDISRRYIDKSSHFSTSKKAKKLVLGL